MGFFSHDSEQREYYDQYGNLQEHHQASVSHELIAGAAAFEAAKAYEKHKEANGEFDSHAKAKEFIAAAAGAFVDREVETRGLDFIDREKAKRHAKEQAHEAYDSNY
ncbi:putative phosphoglycerate mutase family protein [Cantharellus anzutake]|uniref:putative phosphoglycerate mutase family protein n=1 Tax=Cantharellus anzutake TaxID=1750568 RepID=UPI001903E8EF|nr:putative phosphoglycerate mutase family protein [Cantharellus anzutake]XP_038913612.1 putative phosphoglycerate mutase family protein [Cantharellus anzutake]KAF8317487.1 putative phosphoglycerate mutase family protein [Cantharellus anzutake]KAF8327549.1 putative phosphoglycerate mutase family protein [Cantharellus anzutake]